MTNQRTSALRVLAFNAAIVLAVSAYLLAGGPLAPDFGLQQLDMITLNEEVPGVVGVEGQSTLFVLAGPSDAPACGRQLSVAAKRRGRNRGLPLRTGLVLVTPDGRGPAVRSASYQADPDGSLAKALALPRAAEGCAPGYAVVDPRGRVRYRSYDPRWAEHAFEQLVLLDEVR